jgi:hypothetical protein
MKALNWIAIGAVTAAAAGDMKKITFNPRTPEEMGEMIARVESELARALGGEQFRLHPIAYRVLKELT